MILLIDNYDSFSYNLVQLIGSIAKEEIKVVRNDEISVEEVEELSPEFIILSPGPGRPEDAGICEDVVRKMQGRCKILGVCLGHQGICEVYGAKIIYVKELMHGKSFPRTFGADTGCPIPFFRGRAGIPAGLPEGNRKDKGRRNYGGQT